MPADRTPGQNVIIIIIIIIMGLPQPPSPSNSTLNAVEALTGGESHQITLNCQQVLNWVTIST